MHEATPIEGGAVALHVSFTIGPTRNWLNLWKPTIDSLEAILGRSTPDRPWHPQDGRITELTLHCQVDPSITNGVAITVRAAALNYPRTD